MIKYEHNTRCCQSWLAVFLGESTLSTNGASTTLARETNCNKLKPVISKQIIKILIFVNIYNHFVIQILLFSQQHLSLLLTFHTNYVCLKNNMCGLMNCWLFVANCFRYRQLKCVAIVVHTCNRVATLRSKWNSPSFPCSQLSLCFLNINNIYLTTTKERYTTGKPLSTVITVTSSHSQSANTNFVKSQKEYGNIPAHPLIFEASKFCRVEGGFPV